MRRHSCSYFGGNRNASLNGTNFAAGAAGQGIASMFITVGPVSAIQNSDHGLSGLPRTPAPPRLTSGSRNCSPSSGPSSIPPLPSSCSLRSGQELVSETAAVAPASNPDRRLTWEHVKALVPDSAMWLHYAPNDQRLQVGNWVLHDTHIFSPTSLNDFRAPGSPIPTFSLVNSFRTGERLGACSSGRSSSFCRIRLILGSLTRSMSIRPDPRIVQFALRYQL
jgi:hypothetical protein